MSSDEGVPWGLPVSKPGTKLERCLLGRREMLLPEAMIEQSHVFNDVVSRETWQNQLTSEQRAHLLTFLPSFPENDKKGKEETLEDLFEGDNFKFGNPLKDFHTKLRDGFYSPDIAKYTNLCRTVKYREYKHRQQTYYSNLLKEILLSRQKVFEQMKKIPPDGHVTMEYSPPPPPLRERTIEHKVRKKYVRLMNEVREECGVEDTSSEEDEHDSPAQRGKKQLFKSLCPIPSPEPTIPSVVATFSAKPTVNGDVTEVTPQSKRQRPFSPVEISEEDYLLMLKNHKKKKLESEDLNLQEYPELNTQNITMQDIMARCQASRKTPKTQPTPENSSLSLAKKKKIRLKEKSDRKLKKVLKMKQENVKIKTEPGYNEDGSALGMNDSFLKGEDEGVPDFPLPETCPPRLSFGQHNNFFSLIKDLLNEFQDGKFTTANLEEKVREWQEAPTSSLNNWFNQQTNWVDIVMSALKFLAGDLIGATPDNFVPFVDYKERAQQWRWIGVGRDSDETLLELFKLWKSNRKDSSTELNDSGQGSPPPPRSWTSFVVRATSEEEKNTFREQEKRRFENPHKAFTYKMHGYESVVGPVKGVYSKENAMNKAREHALLISNRPSFVTILTLVRDAAARLPNGEGTRGDICELLKDSQFLAPGVSDAQINVVVSGALDRLHSEKDPCVKYDVNRKLWIYLHRSRAEDEFERIHQAHAAAQKARKSLQKPKAQKTQKVKELTSQTPSTPSLTSASSPRLTQSLSASTESLNALDSSQTPSSPVVTGSPTPKGTPSSPVVGQVSPRAVGSPRATSSLVTAMNKSGTTANLLSSGSGLPAMTGATIRFQIQQLQQQQQQQQQQLQQAGSLPGTPTKGLSPGSHRSPSVSVSTALQQSQPDTPTGVSKTLNLHNVRALMGSNPQGSSALAQNLGQQICPELLLHGSRGGTPSHSPAHTPTHSQTPTLVTKKTSTVATTASGLQTMIDASNVTSTVPSTGVGAPLVARLVAGNQMVSVSNLLAAQRAQAQSPRSTTIKIQGSNMVHQVAGGKPVQFTGKPRGQLVQIGGKGQQQIQGLLQTQQGALPTISIISQGSGGGVMTLAQPRTPTATSESSMGSPATHTVTTNSRLTNPSVVNTATPVGSQAMVQMVSQPKVVTPGQGGIVVTQLPHGSITLRPGAMPASSQAKVVTAGQAGLLPQFIVQQSSGGLTSNNATITQSFSGGKPLQIMSGASPKQGQNIQVVRTVLGQQGGLKPGQATILISQPQIPDGQATQATVLPSGQIIPNPAKAQGKGSQKGKGQTGAVYARIIAPPPGLKLAGGQGIPAQGVGMLQTVNKLNMVQAAGRGAVSMTHVGDSSPRILAATALSTSSTEVPNSDAKS
ncbi:Nuclear factor related to kappa-B-binding protein [Mizuhopecten yessoensis]|uniref:Nuclear factor related to kappa-B-binding protein n=1 Tax=Mizuhopecten yessoensis TaxID=6573 RepID=A0A210QQZ4_MIZYE|nr:Nuclear factor related to kappa-B-binding protein [Mizuhopecten yessoensis]